MPAEKKKKKPKIEYEVSDNGNVIEARIDDKTSFISLKRPMMKRKKGGFGLLPGLKAEGETESEDKWLTVVWEEGYGPMPPSVWDEKRRKDILKLAKGTISTASGIRIDEVAVSGGTGTVFTWDYPLAKCEKCGSLLPSNFKYCHICGNPVSQ